MVAVAAAGPADRWHGIDLRVVMGVELAVFGGLVGGLLGFAVLTMQLKRRTSVAVGLIIGLALAYVRGMYSPLSVSGSWNTLFMVASILTFPLVGLIASMYLKRLTR
jgi:uncharacterized membrane protein